MFRVITPSWWSSEFPYGYPWLREDQLRKVSEGNEFARFTAQVCRLYVDNGMAFWCENPATSFIWWLSEMWSLLDHDGVDLNLDVRLLRLRDALEEEDSFLNQHEPPKKEDTLSRLQETPSSPWKVVFSSHVLNEGSASISQSFI